MTNCKLKPKQDIPTFERNAIHRFVDLTLYDQRAKKINLTDGLGREDFNTLYIYLPSTDPFTTNTCNQTWAGYKRRFAPTATVASAPAVAVAAVAVAATDPLLPTTTLLPQNWGKTLIDKKVPIPLVGLSRSLMAAWNTWTPSPVLAVTQSLRNIFVDTVASLLTPTETILTLQAIQKNGSQPECNVLFYQEKDPEKYGLTIQTNDGAIKLGWTFTKDKKGDFRKMESMADENYRKNGFLSNPEQTLKEMLETLRGQEGTDLAKLDNLEAEISFQQGLKAQKAGDTALAKNLFAAAQQKKHVDATYQVAQLYFAEAEMWEKLANAESGLPESLAQQQHLDQAKQAYKIACIAVETIANDTSDLITLGNPAAKVDWGYCLEQNLIKTHFSDEKRLGTALNLYSNAFNQHYLLGYYRHAMLPLRKVEFELQNKRPVQDLSLILRQSKSDLDIFAEGHCNSDIKCMDAQFELANLYITGWKVEKVDLIKKDPDKGKQLIKKLADEGFGKAKQSLNKPKKDGEADNTTIEDYSYKGPGATTNTTDTHYTGPSTAVDTTTGTGYTGPTFHVPKEPSAPPVQAESPPPTNDPSDDDGEEDSPTE